MTTDTVAATGSITTSDSSQNTRGVVIGAPPSF